MALQDFKKISEGIYELPKEGSMRVPGKVFGTEKIISALEQGAIEQIKNVATLPGIQKYSIAEPDVHLGYGFPIGGVAAFDLEQGIVSPGGVGFDINCLPAGTKVLHRHGFYKKIEEFENAFEKDAVLCLEKNDVEKKLGNSKIRFFLRKRESKSILKVRTESGIEVFATKDHPFFTKNGMINASLLSEQQEVAVFPFEGMPFEEPSDRIIADVDLIRKHYVGSNKGLKQTLSFLKKQGLLPLKENNEKMPLLAKVCGFVQGDGTLHFLKNGGALAGFYGRLEDLKEIKKDLSELGFGSHLHSRHRHHKIKTSYEVVEFFYEENSLQSGSSSLVALLSALGCTTGNKTKKEFLAPDWMLKTPLWLKRLYLAAFFGAELSSPKTVSGHGFNFYCPILSMNKKKEVSENCKRFLEQIKALLEEFGIQSSLITERKEFVNEKGEISIRHRLQISAELENLERLWGKIGFEYNSKKLALANAAILYLRLKKKILDSRQESIASAREMKKGGKTVNEIVQAVNSQFVNKRFVQRSIGEGRKTSARIAMNFEKFSEFKEKRMLELFESGFLWDNIEKIEEVPFDGIVYDFTLASESHNFIANNFSVSNCGIRAMLSNLEEKDIKPKLKELMDSLFKEIPSGVGSKGKLKFSEKELKEVLNEGAEWVVRKGYGWKQDLERTEDYGRLEAADAGKVSSKALQRGMPQTGTLGSGNHFLEIQKVERIFDEKTAKAFGLWEGQIITMIHSGSRGCGHQIATDYIDEMLKAMQKYKIEVSDRQLSCAPINSKEGKDYIAAMSAAANYAYANRQAMMHWARDCFESAFKQDSEKLGLKLLYDVCHNIAKFEEHEIDGKKKKVLVHRKGATRAFPAGLAENPKVYLKTGHPVIIPGSMGTASYILVGTEKGMQESFASVCFTGNTKILTDKGIVTLEQIFKRMNEGEKFISPSLNEENLEIEWKPIINTMKRESKVIEVSASQTGRSKFGNLETTENHKFLVFENGNISSKTILEIINEEEMVCVAEKIEIPKNKISEPNLAYLIGALMSDGYFKYGKRRGIVQFIQKKTPEKLGFINHVQNCFMKEFGENLRETRTHTTSGVIRGKKITGTATYFTCTKQAPAKVIANIDERLDEWAMSLDEESTLNYLAGLIDGDGAWNLTHKLINIFSGDSQVVASIVIACLKLGFLPAVSKQRGNCYIIQISEKITQICEYTKRVKGTERKRKYGTKLFSAKQLFGNHQNLRWPFLHKLIRNNLISSEIISKHIHKYPEIKEKITKILDSPLKMQRIKKIKDCGIKEVFNVTIKDNHNYFVFTDAFTPIAVKNCHGAGRAMSRHGALKQKTGIEVKAELEAKGEIVRTASIKGLAEEMPEAYKDVNEVVKSCELAGIARIVAKVKPLAVMKG